jgi:hypothetical protein
MSVEAPRFTIGRTPEIKIIFAGNGNGEPQPPEPTPEPPPPPDPLPRRGDPPPGGRPPIIRPSRRN